MSKFISPDRLVMLVALTTAPLLAVETPTLTTPVGDVAVFPADNPWNQRVDRLKIHPRSKDYLDSIGLEKPVHPDFGTVWNGAPMGIPYNIISDDIPAAKVTFQYASESDAGPYRIPKEVRIEGGPKAPLDSDRHILLIDPKKMMLYEIYQANLQPNGSWKAGSGAVFDLTKNTLRTKGWTSADAAGLPIFPGLARYDEIVEKKKLLHALRSPLKRRSAVLLRPPPILQVSQMTPNFPPWGCVFGLRPASIFPAIQPVPASFCKA